MLLRAKSSWVLKNLHWWRFHSLLEPNAPVLYQSCVKPLFLYIQLEYLLLKFGSVGSCPSFKKSLPLFSPQFLLLNWRQQINFSLVFSSPGWIKLVWWTPCRCWWPIPQLVGFEVPVDGTLLSILTAFPGNAILSVVQGHCVLHPGLEQRFSSTTPSELWEVPLVGWLLFPPLQTLCSCEFSVHTVENSLLTHCSPLQSMSLQFVYQNCTKIKINDTDISLQGKNTLFKPALPWFIQAGCSQWPFYSSCAWKLISWSFTLSFFHGWRLGCPVCDYLLRCCVLQIK